MPSWEAAATGLPQQEAAQGLPRTAAPAFFFSAQLWERELVTIEEKRVYEWKCWLNFSRNEDISPEIFIITICKITRDLGIESCEL